MKTVIFDLDGALADINHRLHHVQDGNKNWKQFYEDCIHDAPKEEVIEMARALEEYGCRIVISSGRSETVRTETLQWLEDNDVPAVKLFMRPDNCYVKDTALKKAWLDEGKFGPKEDILFVVEDRDTMVQMWRSQGLTCLQVEQWVEEGEQSFPIAKIKQFAQMDRYLNDTSQVQRFHDWVKGQA